MSFHPDDLDTATDPVDRQVDPPAAATGVDPSFDHLFAPDFKLHLLRVDIWLVFCVTRPSRNIYEIIHASLAKSTADNLSGMGFSTPTICMNLVNTTLTTQG